MKARQTIALWTLLVSAFLVNSTAQGQPPYYSTASSPTPVSDPRAGSAVMQQVMGQAMDPAFGPTLNFTSQLDDGLGYLGNLYTIDSLIPWHLDPGYSLFFLTASGSVTEAGEGVASVGVGYREYVESMHRVFGVAGLVDFDNGHQSSYQRWSVALESLGKYVDYRVNGYVMMGDDSSQLSTRIINNTYAGNHIVLTRQTITEHAYEGVDFELGGPMPVLGRYGLNVYSGGYYLDSDGAESTFGWKLRGELLVTEDVTAGVNYYNDRVFGQNAFASITVSLPDGKRNRFLKPRRVQERLRDPLVRERRIQADTLVRDSLEPALNPADGEPFFVLFVDPDAAFNGDGSFESPFSSMDNLVNRSFADMIVVRSRTDNTGTNLTRSGPLSLFDNQRLLGASLPHSVLAIQDTVILPTLSLTRPRISNGDISGGSAVINLANNNEVSGFIINGANTTGTDFGIGILGGAETNGFSINNTDFTAYTDAVLIPNAGGRGEFFNNAMTGTPGVSSNGLLMTANNAASPMSLLIQGNTADGNELIGIGVTADGTTIDATGLEGTPASGIEGNVLTANGTGLELNTANGGIFSAEIVNNTFQNNTQDGFAANVNTGQMDVVSFLNNTSTNNDGNGTAFRAAGGSISIAEFGTNALSFNGENGLLLSASDSGLIDAQIGSADVTAPDNVFSSNGVIAGNGLLVQTTTNGTVQGAIINNQFINHANGGHGISLRSNPSGTIDFGTVASGRMIQGNTVSGNEGAGLFIESIVSPGNLANVDATLLGNTIINNLGGGIMTSQAGSNHNLPLPPIIPFPAGTPDTNILNLVVGGTLASEDLNGNGILDLGEDLNDDGELNLNDTNLILNNSIAGVRVQTGGESRANVLIQNNRIAGTLATDTDPDGDLLLTDGDGIRLDRSDSSIMQAEIRSNILTGNASDGLHATAVGMSPESLIQPIPGVPSSIEVIENEISLNNGSGGFFRTFGDAVLLTNASRNVVDANQHHGFAVHSTQNSAFGDPLTPPADAVGTRSVFDGNTITSNQHNGIDLKAEDAARVLLQVTSITANTEITGNGLLDSNDGLDLADSLAHPTQTEVLGTTGRNGIRFATNGGRSNVLVNSGGLFTTTIGQNGNSTLGGNGIQIIARNTIPDGLGNDPGENSTFTVQSATIEGHINGTGAGNDIHGDGIQVVAYENANPNVVIGGTRALGLGNSIVSNAGDGISASFAGDASPSITIEGNSIGGAGLSGSNVAFANGGHGLNVRTDLLETQFADGTLVATGSTPTVRVSDNEIVSNAQRGISIVLRGALGSRIRNAGAVNADFRPAEFRIDNGNVIDSNGLEGIFYETNPGFVNNFSVTFPGFNPDGQVYPPGSLAPIYNLINSGSLGNQSFVMDGSALNPPRSNALNLNVSSNSLLIITDNSIATNGRSVLDGNPASDGVFLRIGNNSYVAADVQDNSFGGNSASDFRTESFITTDLAGNQIVPTDSVDDTANNDDTLVFDDAALLDLRFNRNINGDSGINVTSTGAVYTNLDILKGSPRLVELFQVDGPAAPFTTLGAPNNTFSIFGAQQDVDGLFNSNRYNLRAAPDPLFPNIAFPPFMP